MSDNLLDKFVVIRNHGFFAGLSNDDFESLNFVHHFKETKKGEYIYFESMYYNKLYFVKGGFVKIGYIDDEGNEIVKEIIGEGEIFGQYTLEKQTSKGEFAQAFKSDVSLCAFTIEDFENLLIKKPNLTLSFTKEIGKKIKSYETRVLSLLNKDVKSRVASFLISICKQENFDLSAEQVVIENVFTHEDIASLIGSSRQTVTTVLNEYIQQELIEMDRQKILIKNLEAVKKIASVV